MKKFSISFCLIAVAVFAFSSCKDEKDDMVTLTVGLEDVGNGKAYIDESNYKPMLVTGDSAYVNNDVFAFNFDNGNVVLQTHHSANNRYRAIFPASIVNTELNTEIRNSDTVYVRIPRVQEYDKVGDVQKVNIPMISYPEGYKLWFRNMCSLVRVNVVNTTSGNITLTNIQLSNNLTSQSGPGYVYLAGNTHVSVPSPSSDPVTIVDPIEENRYVQLNLNGHPDATIASGDSAYYYLIVAPFSGATSGMNIRVNATTHFNDKPLPQVSSLARNVIAKVRFEFR